MSSLSFTYYIITEAMWLVIEDFDWFQRQVSS